MIKTTTRQAMIISMVWLLAFTALVVAQQPTKPGDQAGEIPGQGRMGERGQMT